MLLAVDDKSALSCFTYEGLELSLFAKSLRYFDRVFWFVSRFFTKDFRPILS